MTPMERDLYNALDSLLTALYMDGTHSADAESTCDLCKAMANAEVSIAVVEALT